MSASLALDAGTRTTILPVFPAGLQPSFGPIMLSATPLSPPAMKLFALGHCILAVIFFLIFQRVTAKRLL